MHVFILYFGVMYCVTVHTQGIVTSIHMAHPLVTHVSSETFFCAIVYFTHHGVQSIVMHGKIYFNKSVRMV